MNSQAKALIPALIGIITLLLAGVTGVDMPRVSRQATVIAETRAITLEEAYRQDLGNAFRTDADAAAREMGVSIAEDLAVELKHQPSISVAQADTAKHERG